MLENIIIQGSGFNVLKDYNSWRIAVLGYENSSNSREGIKTLGRHLETIEVFVLVKGSAFMITAGCESEPSNLSIERLEMGKLYIIQEKQWHGAVLDPESTLLVIENRNTDNLNSETCFITKENKEELNYEFI